VPWRGGSMRYDTKTGRTFSADSHSSCRGRMGIERPEEEKTLDSFPAAMVVFVIDFRSNPPFSEVL